MAIERYNTLNNAPAVAPLPQRRPDTETGEILSELGGNLGAEASARARQGAAVQQEAQAQLQRTEAAKRLAQFKQDQNQAFADARDKAAAGAPDFTPTVLKSYDAAAKSTLDGITDPDTRAYLDVGMAEFRGAVQGDALGFERDARVGKKTADLQSTVDLNRNTVAGNPSQFKPALGQTLAAIEASGLPAAEIAKLKQQAVNGLAASAIGGGVETDPEGTLKALQGKDWDAYVDPDQKIGFINQAQAEIKRRAEVAKQEAQQQRMMATADLDVRFRDSVATAAATGAPPTVNGVPAVSEAEIRALHPGKTGELMVRQLHTATGEGQDRVAILGNDPAQDAALQAKYAPPAVPGAAYTEEDADRYQKITAQIAAKRTAFAKDPATAATQTSAAVANAWADVAKAQADPNATPEMIAARSKTAIALSTQEQIRQGVDPVDVKILPDATRSLIVRKLGAAKPQEVADTVDQVTGLYGVKGLQELIAGGAPSSILPIAGANAPGDAAWRDTLIRYQQQKPGEVAGQAEARGVKPADIDTQFQSQAGHILDAIPASSQGAYIDAVKGVATQMAAHGMAADQAMKFALQPFEQGYAFHGSYAVPAQFDDAKVSAGLNAVLQNIGLYPLAAESSASGNPATDGGSPAPAGKFAGMTAPGNIDLAKRPMVDVGGGEIATVRSMSFEENGQEILVPTVSPDGKLLSNHEAMELYHKTGQFLGKFDNPDDADAYAEALHEAQGRYYGAAQYRIAQQQTALQRGSQWLPNQSGDGVVLAYETGDPVLLQNGAPLEVKFSDAQAVRVNVRPVPGQKNHLNLPGLTP